MTDRDDQAITEFELMAYIDDQLDAAQRLDVEYYLSRHPDLAAQVMADLHARDALRMAQRAPTPPSSRRTVQAISRLDGAVSRRWVRHLGWPAAFATFAGLGWVGHEAVSPPGTITTISPSIVDDAVRAHRTAVLRAQTPSQARAAVLDSAEISQVAHVELPALPSGWRVTDVQLFPSQAGPGVEVMLDPPGPAAKMSLFAVETDAAVPTQPALARRGPEDVAYWRVGKTAIALTGTDGALVGKTAFALAGHAM